MNLQQLRAICAVAERECNISAAARVLNATQPAVSKQIRGFETELQTAIFIREKGRLTGLTPAGGRIVTAARSMLGAAAEIRALCGATEAAAAGRLVIAASRSRARNFLPDIIRAFTARHPGVEVSVVHGTLGEMVTLVLNGEASLAITIENRPQPAAIVALPFGEIPRVVIVPRGHRLLQEKELTLAAMAACPLVLYDESFSIREEVLQAFRVAGLEPKIAMSAAEAEVIKAYVAHGLGIAVVARTAFDPRSDMLRALPADHLFPRAIARVLVSRTHFLTAHEYDFIRLCAPSLTPGLVRRQMQKAVSAR